jgi:MoaA/NifB/PqqE/SkfB family radical SAM enzyme
MHTYVTAEGSLSPCCESQEFKFANQPKDLGSGLNSEAYKRLRLALLNGEQPTTCVKCWKNEAQGFMSAREEALVDAKRGLFGDIPPRVCSKTGEIDSHISFLEIKTSNVCNLKCRMCHPESSCRLTEDKEIISKYRSIDVWPEKALRATGFIDALIADLPNWGKNLRMVRYSGGEPLIDPDQYRLTRALSNFKGPELELRYATNLTHIKFENQDVIELWKRFRRVHVKISIDGVDDVYNYVRVGSNFDKVFDNFKRLCDRRLPNMDLSIGCTVSAFNCFQLPEIYERFKSYLPENSVRFFLLHDPQQMHIRNYPPEIREKILAKLEPYPQFDEFSKFLRGVSWSDPKIWDKLLAFMAELDQRYGETQNIPSLLQKYLV